MKEIKIRMVQNYEDGKVILKKGEETDSNKINPLLVGHLVFEGYAIWI